MITVIFIFIFGIFLELLSSLLPVWDLPQSIFDALVFLYQGAMSLNWLLPIDTLFQVLLWLLGWEVIKVVFWVVLWVFAIIFLRRLV